MTRRVVIHAGLPKCGSTSLQLRLLGARRELAQHGIAYPLTERATGRLVFDPDCVTPWAPQHMALAHALEGAEPPAALLDGLRTFAASGADTLVLSSESFGPRARVYAEPAFAPLRDHAVEVVLFARRRDDWLLAMYKQSLRTWRRRYRGSFRRWLADPPAYDAHTAALRVSDVAERLAAVTGGRVRVFDLDAAGPRPDTGQLFGDVLGVPLERWPDWSSDRLGTLRGAERRAGLPVNATHGDAAALFLAMTDADALDQPMLMEVAATALEFGFADAAPPVTLLTPDLSADLLAGGVKDRARLGFRPLAPRAAPPGPQPRETLTVAEWRRMADRLMPHLAPDTAAGLRAAAGAVRELD